MLLSFLYLSPTSGFGGFPTPLNRKDYKWKHNTNNSMRSDDGMTWIIL